MKSDGRRHLKRARGMPLCCSTRPSQSIFSCAVANMNECVTNTGRQVWCWFFLKKGCFYQWCNNSDACVLLSGDQEGLADHQQHRHHEGRSEGVLVCPHRRVSVLVQRRRGEMRAHVNAMLVLWKASWHVHNLTDCLIQHSLIWYYYCLILNICIGIHAPRH